MKQTPKYFIVEAQALPEIYRKVAEAKRLMETGEAVTVNQATRMMVISRSAFYKYKDSVRPFSDMLHGRIVTFQAVLKDQPGVLSAVINLFAVTGGNILTINQGIPVNGCAAVTIGAETSGLSVSFEELLSQLSGLPGVLRCEILAG
jgi:chorismate mutase